MSRIGTITIACAALLLTATATSLSWQVGTRLTLVTSDGAKIIGVGEIVDFDLRLTLANGYSGLAVLVVESPGGSLETFDLVVEEGGTVLLGEDGDYSDLGKAAEDSGLAYRVLFEDGGPDEAETEARKRPASISPRELADFVEHEGRVADEDGRGPDMDVLGTGAAGTGAGGAGEDVSQPQVDEPQMDDGPKRGRGARDRRGLPGDRTPRDGRSGWGPGSN